MFIVDDRYTVIHWNAAAETAFDLPACDVLGRPCFAVLEARSAAGRPLCSPHCQKWALARRGAHVHNFDMRAFSEPGVWLNISILPIRAPSGRLVALAHLARNINHAVRLERYLRDIASSASELLAGTSDSRVPAEPSPAHLTPREIEVLRLIAHGCDTDGIAEALGISPHTARNHVAALLGKLGLHSRVEAAAYAFTHELM